MKKEEILEKINLFEKQGYRKCSSEVDGGVMTPRGVYEISDLIIGLCPLCEGYLRDNPEVEETSRCHDKEDLKDIEKARSLAKLVSDLKILELGERGIFIEREHSNL